MKQEVYLFTILRNYSDTVEVYLTRLFQNKPSLDVVLNLYDEYVGDTTDMPDYFSFLETNHRENNKDKHKIIEDLDEYALSYENYVIELKKMEIYK